MATFVLVHGAWGGAHGWRKVRPRLHAGGHAVFTPSLTGIGERAHLTGPHVDLSVHVDDVVNTVLYEDLTDIVLLGYSYGGMVVTGTLDRIGDRVRELVYLDAFVPADGQCVADLSTLGDVGAPDPGPAAPWLVPPLPREFSNPAEAAWESARRTPQPVRCFTDPVRLTQPLEAYPFGRTYVKATGDARHPTGPDPFWDTADRLRGNPAWRSVEIAENHMIPQNAPDALVAVLLDLT